MLKKAVLMGILTLMTATCALAGQSRSRPRAGSDKAQIQALEKRFAEAFLAKDVNRIMSVYARGQRLFVFDVTPPRQHVGWEDYKKDWEDFLALFDGPITFELDDLEITTDGRLGFSHSIQHVAGKMHNGQALDLTVRVTDGYEKIGGRWLIVQEHVSVPVDITTGKADLSSRP